MDKVTIWWISNLLIICGVFLLIIAGRYEGKVWILNWDYLIFPGFIFAIIGVILQIIYKNK